MDIGIIVDSPQRDLKGHAYLGSQIIKDNKVFLIPVYDQQYAINNLNLDIIIFNYLRPNNFWLIALAKSKKIKVVIVDTEGARGKNLDTEAKFVAKSIINLDVDLYFSWSDKVRDKILENSSNLKNKVITSGCHRFYLYSPKFKYEKIEKKYILINTRFPKANPKFAKVELSTLTEAGFFEYKEAVDYLNKEKKVLNNFLITVKKIIENFKEESFIIRPHPFENANIYKNYFKNNKNVKIEQSEDIIDVIKSCKLMIHLNCQTCFEAYLFNVNSIELEFLNSKVLKALDASKISYQAESYEDAIKKITEKININLLEKDELDFNKKVNKISENFGPINQSVEIIKKNLLTINLSNEYFNKSKYTSFISYSNLFRYKIKTIIPHYFVLQIIKIFKKKNWVNRIEKSLNKKYVDNFYNSNNINNINSEYSDKYFNNQIFNKTYNIICLFEK